MKCVIKFMQIRCDFCPHAFWWQRQGIPIVWRDAVCCNECEKKNEVSQGTSFKGSHSLPVMGVVCFARTLPYAPDPVSEGVDDSWQLDFANLSAKDDTVDIPTSGVAASSNANEHYMPLDDVIDKIRAKNVGENVTNKVNKLSAIMQGLYEHRANLETTVGWVSRCRAVADVFLSVDLLVTAKLYSNYALQCLDKIKHHSSFQSKYEGHIFYRFEKYLICTDHIINLHIMFSKSDKNVNRSEQGKQPTFSGPVWNDLNVLSVFRGSGATSDHVSFGVNDSARVLKYGVVSAHYTRPAVESRQFGILDKLYTLFMTADQELYHTYSNIDIECLLYAFTKLGDRCYAQNTMRTFTDLNRTERETHGIPTQNQGPDLSEREYFMSKWAHVKESVRSNFVKETIKICEDLTSNQCEHMHLTTIQHDTYRRHAENVLTHRNVSIMKDCTNEELKGIKQRLDEKLDNITESIAQDLRETVRKKVFGLCYANLMETIYDFNSVRIPQPNSPSPSQTSRHQNPRTLSSKIRQSERDQVRSHVDAEKEIEGRDRAEEAARLIGETLIAEEAEALRKAKLKKDKLLARKNKRNTKHVNVVDEEAGAKEQSGGEIQHSNSLGQQAAGRPTQNAGNITSQGPATRSPGNAGAGDSTTKSHEHLTSRGGAARSPGNGSAECAVSKSAGNGSAEGAVSKSAGNAAGGGAAKSAANVSAEDVASKSAGDHAQASARVPQSVEDSMICEFERLQVIDGENKANIKKLQNRLRALKATPGASSINGSNFVCVVCNSNEPNMLFDPCKHVCICESCKDTKVYKHCPVCLKGVSDIRKVFIS